MMISSCCLNGIFFALRKPVFAFLSQIKLYLQYFSLANINLAENIPCPNNRIAPLSFIILLYWEKSSDKSIGQSHFEIFKVEEDGSEKFILGRMALTVGTWRLGNND